METELNNWKKTEITEDELKSLILYAERVEDCILKGIPPHSGYKGAAKKNIENIIYKLKQKAKDLK